jgi:hypothetical protein
MAHFPEGDSEEIQADVDITRKICYWLERGVDP